MFSSSRACCFGAVASAYFIVLVSGVHEASAQYGSFRVFTLQIERHAAYPVNSKMVVAHNHSDTTRSKQIQAGLLRGYKAVWGAEEVAKLHRLAVETAQLKQDIHAHLGHLHRLILDGAFANIVWNDDSLLSKLQKLNHTRKEAVAQVRNAMTHPPAELEPLLWTPFILSKEDFDTLATVSANYHARGNIELANQLWKEREEHRGISDLDWIGPITPGSEIADVLNPTLHEILLRWHENLEEVVRWSQQERSGASAEEAASLLDRTIGTFAEVENALDASLARFDEAARSNARSRAGSHPGIDTQTRNEIKTVLLFGANAHEQDYTGVASLLKDRYGATATDSTPTTSDEALRVLASWYRPPKAIPENPASSNR